MLLFVWGVSHSCQGLRLSLKFRIFVRLLYGDASPVSWPNEGISSQSSCSVLRPVIDSISTFYHLSCNYRLPWFLCLFSRWWRSTVSDLETLQFNVYLLLLLLLRCSFFHFFLPSILNCSFLNSYLICLYFSGSLLVFLSPLAAPSDRQA